MDLITTQARDNELVRREYKGVIRHDAMEVDKQSGGKAMVSRLDLTMNPRYVDAEARYAAIKEQARTPLHGGNNRDAMPFDICHNNSDFIELLDEEEVDTGNHLLSLSSEVIENIIDYLDASAAGCLRLTCHLLDDLSFNRFLKKFCSVKTINFRDKNTDARWRGGDTLEELDFWSKNTVFGLALNTLNFRPVHTLDLLHLDKVSEDDFRTWQELKNKAVAREFNDRHTKYHRLSQILLRLKNLQEINIYDTQNDLFDRRYPEVSQAVAPTVKIVLDAVANSGTSLCSLRMPHFEFGGFNSGVYVNDLAFPRQQLSVFASLRSLELCLTISDRAEEDPSDEDLLESQEYYQRWINWVPRFISAATSLEELRLSFDGEETSNDVFHAMSERIKLSSLHTLSLSCFMVDSQDLVRLLKEHSPTLRHFEARHCQYRGDSFVSVLQQLGELDLNCLMIDGQGWICLGFDDWVKFWFDGYNHSDYFGANSAEEEELSSLDDDDVIVDDDDGDDDDDDDDDDVDDWVVRTIEKNPPTLIIIDEDQDMKTRIGELISTYNSG